MALKPLSINNANHDTHIYLSSTNYTMGTHKDEELFLQYLALLLLLRSGDVITNPGPLKANGSIHRRTLVVVAAKVSLPAVEQSRVVPADSGHTTDVQVCPAM